jgi:hypothetical protein
MLSKIPGGEALAGLIVQDNEEREKKLLEKPLAEPKVSFTIKEDETIAEVKKEVCEEPSEEDKGALSFVKQLKEKFTHEQMTKTMLILDVLSNSPTDIDKTLQYLSDLHKK